MERDIFFIYIVKFLLHFKLYSIIEALIPLKNGVSFKQLGIVLLFYQISKWFFEVPTGVIADKYGRKYSCIISIIFSEIFLIMLLYSKSFYFILVAFVFNGIAYSFFTGSIDALLIDTVIKKGLKDKLDKYNIIERIVFYISIGLSNILGGEVAIFSYKMVLILSVLLNIITLFLILFLKETIERKTRPKLNFNELKSIFKYKELFLIFIIDILIAFSMVPIDNFYTIFLKNIGFIESSIGIIKASQFIFSSVIILILRKKNIYSKQFIYLPIVMLIVFLVFSMSNNVYLSIIFYTFGLFIFCLYAPQKHKYFHSNIDSNIRGTIISIMALFISLSGTISHFIFTIISNKVSLNNFFSLILCISILLISLSIIYIKLKYKNKKRIY